MVQQKDQKQSLLIIIHSGLKGVYLNSTAGFIFSEKRIFLNTLGAENRADFKVSYLCPIKIQIFLNIIRNQNQ